MAAPARVSADLAMQEFAGSQAAQHRTIYGCASASKPWECGPPTRSSTSATCRSGRATANGAPLAYVPF